MTGAQVILVFRVLLLNFFLLSILDFLSVTETDFVIATLDSDVFFLKFFGHQLKKYKFSSHYQRSDMTNMT